MSVDWTTEDELSAHQAKWADHIHPFPPVDPDRANIRTRVWRDYSAWRIQPVVRILADRGQMMPQGGENHGRLYLTREGQRAHRVKSTASTHMDGWDKYGVHIQQVSDVGHCAAW